MEYTSRKKRSSRWGVRIVGCLFCFGAVLYILHSYKQGWSGSRMLFLLIAIAFIVVGGNYIRQTFAITAYDITYIIKPEYLEMKTYRGSKKIAYEEMKKITISKVSEDMDYYVIHILAKGYNLVIHILSEGEKAQDMYHLLLESSGLEEEN